MPVREVYREAVLRANVLWLNGRAVGQPLSLSVEFGGLADEAFRAGHGADFVVEAIAVESALPEIIYLFKLSDRRVGVGDDPQPSAGLRGRPWPLACAGEDKGFRGSKGSAPGFLRGVPEVACGKALKGGFAHKPRVSEYAGGFCFSCGHSLLSAG